MILEATVEVTEETVQVAKDFWETVRSYLTPQTITVITTVLLFFVALLKLVSALKTLKKQSTMTLENVLSAFKEYVDSILKIELMQQYKNVLNPIIVAIDKVNKNQDIFSQILTLQQEDSPTSRLAILQLIKQLGTVEIEKVEQVEESIDTEVEEQEQVVNALDEIAHTPIE